MRLGVPINTIRGTGRSLWIERFGISNKKSMPLYIVRRNSFKDTIEAVSPSRAACKAYHAIVRKHPDVSDPIISVITEGKRYDQLYRVSVVPIESPSAFEASHRITHAAKAVKISRESKGSVIAPCGSILVAPANPALSLAKELVRKENDEEDDGIVRQEGKDG